MSTAIIVLNYNDADTTLKYLQTIKQYKAYDHIIVVDNASTDGRTEEIGNYCKNQGIDFLESPENKGYSSGNNLGAFYAIEKYDPEYIIISNPDIICHEDSVKKMLESYSTNKDIGLVTGLVHIFDSAHNTIPYKYFAYKVPSINDMLCNCLLFSTAIRMKVLKNSIYFNPVDVMQKDYLYVGCVSGCYFTIRADVFREINGLDEDIFLYNEEAVLGFSLKKHGYKELVVNAPLIHDEKADKHKGLKKQWTTHKRVQTSSLVYLKKHLKASDSTCKLFVALNTFGFVERYIYSLIR